MTTPTTPIAASVDLAVHLQDFEDCVALWLYRFSQRACDEATAIEGIRRVVARFYVPGTRDASYADELDNYDGLASEEASPTAPRAEGGVEWGYALGRTYLSVNGVTVAVEGYPCHDATLGIGVWTSEAIKMVATGQAPPRDRCEVCKFCKGSRIMYQAQPVPCPRCTKETPCESGSGSSVGSRAGTNTQSDTKPASDVAPSVTAASDPATVAGEGPYRVEQAEGGWIIKGPGFLGACPDVAPPSDERALTISYCMTRAHRTALAVREAEVNELRKNLEVSEKSVHYWCDMYKAAVAPRDALKGDAR
jgi:hypothetical protein